MGNISYYTQNMHVEWKIVTDNPQMKRKLKDFAKMCCTCNTSPKLALRTSVTTSHVTCLLPYMFVHILLDLSSTSLWVTCGTCAMWLCVDSPTDWLIDWVTDWLTDWLIYWLVDWFIDWLIDWLIYWLSHWVSEQIFSCFGFCSWF